MDLCIFEKHIACLDGIGVHTCPTQVSRDRCPCQESTPQDLTVLEVLQFHVNGMVHLKINPDIDMALGVSVTPADLKTGVSIISPTCEETVYDSCDKEIIIENPALWWPNGYRKQNLYTVTVTLKKAVFANFITVRN